MEVRNWFRGSRWRW